MLGAKRKKKRDLEAPPRVVRPRIPPIMFFRMFVIGTFAVVAAVYAVWRAYSVRPTPMRVPAPPPTEIPAPDLEP